MSDQPIYKVNERINTILCDIEGTTTSISFVKDILFTYVKDHLRTYLYQNYDNETCREDIKLLIELANQDSKINNQVPIIEENFENKNEVIESTVKNVLWQMSLDRKSHPLKQLQGHIWKDAYERGLVKGHVYDDVVPTFQKLVEKGYKIYIYSSGSIEAQKLLFQYSEKGNLLQYLSGHFDISTSGLKFESDSYKNILNSLNKNANQVLFLTDMINEYNAAAEAGIEVCLLRRDIEYNINEANEYNWVKNFNEIIIN